MVFSSLHLTQIPNSPIPLSKLHRFIVIEFICIYNFLAFTNQTKEINNKKNIESKLTTLFCRLCAIKTTVQQKKKCIKIKKIVITLIFII